MGASAAIVAGGRSRAGVAGEPRVPAGALPRLHGAAGDGRGRLPAAVWRAYAALMVVPAVLVVAQYGWQLRAGAGERARARFPLSAPRCCCRGMSISRAREVWRTWDRPNGVFFLEPSFCSAFLALAFLNEALWLRRRGFAALFLGGAPPLQRRDRPDAGGDRHRLAAPPFAFGDAGGRRDRARCWSR